jgi:hypothetical protein
MEAAVCVRNFLHNLLAVNMWLMDTSRFAEPFLDQLRSHEIWFQNASIFVRNGHGTSQIQKQTFQYNLVTKICQHVSLVVIKLFKACNSVPPHGQHGTSQKLHPRTQYVLLVLAPVTCQLNQNILHLSPAYSQSNHVFNASIFFMSVTLTMQKRK